MGKNKRDNKENGVEVITETNLPPAGDERREVLAERTDNLEEQGEKLADEMEMESIDPSAFEPEPEMQYLLHKYDMTDFTNPVKGFAYSWVHTGQHGYFVTSKKVEGWIVVQGKDPEAKEFRSEDSLRRIGDTILMKIPQARMDVILKYREEKAKNRYDASTSQVKEIVSKHGKLFTLHEDMGDVNIGNRNLTDIVQSKSTAAGLRREGAKKIAAHGVGEMLKSGTVPGL